MALQAELDYALQVIAEPGYFQHLTPTQVGLHAQVETADIGPAKSLWTDAASGTVMLKPLQLTPGWLDSDSQLSSIIGLTDHGSGAVVYALPADLASQAIFEAVAHHNVANPWIHHKPTTPTLTDPIAGQPAQGNLQEVDKHSETRLSLTAFPPGMAVPPLLPGVGPDTSQCICYVPAEKMPANQAIFFRHYVPYELAGSHTYYAVMIGQFCLLSYGPMFEVFKDISPAGTRDQWRLVKRQNLFSPGDDPNVNYHSYMGMAAIGYGQFAEHAFMFLPYRRHYCYVGSNFGKHTTFPARVFPQRITDPFDSTKTIWDITRSDSLSIWVGASGSGRFQLQYLKYPTETISLKVPQFTIDYTPVTTPDGSAVALKGDADDASALTASAFQTPPEYGTPVDEYSTCEVATSDATELSRTFTFRLNFTAGTDQRWTPFCYGYDIRVPMVAGTWPNASVLLKDARAAPSTSLIQGGRFTSSTRRGESFLELQVFEEPPFAAAARWYTADVPVKLSEDGNTRFIGLTEPAIIQPLRNDNNIARLFTVKAVDLWKLLVDATLRDQRDWGPSQAAAVSGVDTVFDVTEGQAGVGHISVVDFIARLAGINTTGADYPKGATEVSALGGSYDVPLGGVHSTILQQDGDLRPPWKPHPTDTAADFIERIAKYFSGWDVGFYPDGIFFYRPKDYYPRTTLGYTDATHEVEFKKSHASGIQYRGPVEFQNIEPELNVLQAVGRDAATGNTLISRPYVDWASILNPNAVNFIGRYRSGVLQRDGGWTCAELDRVCRVAWDQARRRFLKVTFEADYYPALKVGHPFKLEGYSQTFRLDNYEVKLTRTGWHPCKYEGTVIERGYGEP